MRRILIVMLIAALTVPIAACGRRPTATAAPPRAGVLITPPPRVGSVDHGMPVYTPDPTIDFKMLFARPNPRVDYKILVVDPSRRDAPGGLAKTAPGSMPTLRR